MSGGRRGEADRPTTSSRPKAGALAASQRGRGPEGCQRSVHGAQPQLRPGRPCRCGAALRPRRLDAHVHCQRRRAGGTRRARLLRLVPNDLATSAPATATNAALLPAAATMAITANSAAPSSSARMISTSATATGVVTGAAPAAAATTTVCGAPAGLALRVTRPETKPVCRSATLRPPWHCAHLRAILVGGRARTGCGGWGGRRSGRRAGRGQRGGGRPEGGRQPARTCDPAEAQARHRAVRRHGLPQPREPYFHHKSCQSFAVCHRGGGRPQG